MGYRDIQAADKGFIRFPRRGQRGVCVYVCACVSHSVDQGHNGLQALLLLSTVGIYKLFGTQQLLYTVNSFSVIPPAMYMGIIWHLLYQLLSNT